MQSTPWGPANQHHIKGKFFKTSAIKDQFMLFDKRFETYIIHLSALLLHLGLCRSYVLDGIFSPAKSLSQGRFVSILNTHIRRSFTTSEIQKEFLLGKRWRSAKTATCWKTCWQRWPGSSRPSPGFSSQKETSSLLTASS